MARDFAGVSIPEHVLQQKAEEDGLRHPLLVHKDDYFNSIEIPHDFHPRNQDFVLSLVLIAFVAVFRFTNPGYFRNLFLAFRNATLSSRQLKDRLEQDYRSSILLNAFFCFSAALFIVQVIGYLNVFPRSDNYSSGIIIAAVMIGLVIIYLGRFLFLKLAGWLFQIPEMTDNYSFHIFLLNKIIGIVLIPFTLILAFGEGQWVQVSLLIAFVMLCFLIIYRYVRSRKLFQYFLKFSKFHFFLYLCASEILPIAILIKLLLYNKPYL